MNDVWAMMHDDITWCGNSDECSNTSCERHLMNKISKTELYSCSNFKNTIMCPLQKNIHSSKTKGE